MKLATLCYVRSGGQTLMLHRIKKENDMHAGKWNGLGGKMEAGETPEACAIREIEEESGLLVRLPVLRGILTFPGFNNDEDWYAFVFVTTNFSGQLIDSPEGELAWIDDDKLLDLNLWPGDRIFLPWLDRDEFFSGRFDYQDGQLAAHHAYFYTAHQVALAGDNGVDLPASIATRSPDGPFVGVYQAQDDTYCWICDGAVTKRHCKIICLACGFTRDCSDP